MQVGPGGGVSSIRVHDAFAFPGEKAAAIADEVAEEAPADGEPTGDAELPGATRLGPAATGHRGKTKRRWKPDVWRNPTTTAATRPTGYALGIEQNDDDAQDDGRLIDVLAPTDADHRLQPRYRFRVGSRPLAQTGFYRCTGYEVDGEGVTVRMERLEAGQTIVSDPAKHPDLAYGSYVDTIVGEVLKVRGQPLRVLNRADAKGRFLLAAGRVGTGNPLIALDTFNQHVIEGLTEGARLPVMVVPTRYGTAAATLIPLLSRQLDHNGVRQWDDQPADGQDKRRPFWYAVIQAVPNANGYATIELLPRDATLGITHRFSVRGPQPGSGPATLVEQAGAPVKAQLRNDLRMRLVPTLDDVESLTSWPGRRVVRFTSIQTIGGGRTSRPAKPRLAAVRDYLLGADRSTLQQLRGVWDFYLRSHTRLVRGLDPGDTATETDVPLPRPEAPVQAYQEFAKDMVVIGLVDEVSDRGVSCGSAMVPLASPRSCHRVLSTGSATT